MLQLLAVHLGQLRHALTARMGERRRGDVGAMNTLELVVLSVGIVAIAALFLGVVREAVSGRLDQLR